MKVLDFLPSFWLISASVLDITAKANVIPLDHRSAKLTDRTLEESQQALKSTNLSTYDVTAPKFRDDWPPSDTRHKDRLRRGFYDALLLAHYGREAAKAASHSLVTPFQDYFRTRDVDAVINVFSNVLGSKIETGNDKYISHVFFKYTDTDDTCKVHKDWSAYNKATSHEGAAESDIVICDQGWVAARELRFPPITCKEVGKQISDATMDSFGRMLLHEILHHKAIGDDAKGVSVPIVDIAHDAHGAYGVCGTRKLLEVSPGETKMNADSYAWMAQEYYWQVNCKVDFKKPKCT